MSIAMDEEIKRWTAKRKSALVMEITQGKKTVAEASRQFDLPPSKIEDWVDQAKAGMETIRQGLQEDDVDVSISKICRYLGIPRRTVYYRPVRSAPEVKPELEAPSRR